MKKTNRKKFIYKNILQSYNSLYQQLKLIKSKKFEILQNIFLFILLKKKNSIKN